MIRRESHNNRCSLPASSSRANLFSTDTAASSCVNAWTFQQVVGGSEFYKSVELPTVPGRKSSFVDNACKPTSSKRISTCGSSAVDVEGFKTIQQLNIHFLRSKLEYTCPVWHGALLERDALALERVQGSVARSILRAPFQASKSVMFEQLTWPSLRWRREILCITLFHLYYTLALLPLIPAARNWH